MSVEIVIGRSGSGKSEKCVDDAKKLCSLKKNVYIIVPDQFSHKSERALSEKIGACSSETVCVITFKRLAQRIFEQCGYFKKNLTKSGKQMIAMRAVYLEKKNLLTYKRSADSAGFSKKVSEIIEEFKRYNITEQMLSDICQNTDDAIPKQKIADLYNIYQRYNKLLSNEYVDAQDNLYVAATLLEQTDYLKGASVFVDEFSDFLPSHYAMLEVILKRAENVKFFMCAAKPPYTEEGFFADSEKTIEKIKELCYRYGLDLKITYMPENLRHKNNFELSEIEKQYTEFKIRPYEGKCENVSIFESNSIYEELEYICAEINRLCRDDNYKLSDICVSLGDVESYKETVKLVFDTYDIPYFMSDKESVCEHPLVVAILSAFDIFLNNFAYEDVFLYLKSGFSNLSNEETDILENYVLEFGIGKKQWLSEEKWEYKNSMFSDEVSEIYENIDEIRRKALKPLLKLREKIGSKHSVRTSAQAVFEFMCDAKMPEKIQKIIQNFKEDGKLFKANMCAAIYNSVLEVLDQCVVIAGDDKIGIRQFKNMLSAGFDGENSALIPQTIDEVYVCSLSDARAAKCKIMFAAGTNTGEYISNAKETGILSDEERDVLKKHNLEIAKSAKEKISNVKVGIYKVVTRPSEKLFLSYSLADFESNAAFASPLCEKVKKILKNVDVYDNLDLDFAYEYKYAKKYPAYLNLCSNLAKYSGGEKIDPVWHGVYDYLKQCDNFKDDISLMLGAINYKNAAKTLSKKITEQLYPNGINASASRLERYRSCPFSYFIEYTLKAKERKILKIGAPDIGSAMHLILEKFVKYCTENKMFAKNLCEEEIRAILLNITNECFSNVLKKTAVNTKSNQYLLKRIEENLVRCAFLLVKHIQSGKFEPVECEMKFGADSEIAAAVIDLTSGKKLKINGIIDRLDKYEDETGTYFRVVDYKSGAKTFSMGKIVYGLDLQLALYLYVATQSQKNAKPAAMLYFKVAEPMISSEVMLSESAAKAEVEKKMKMDGVVLANDDIIKAMDLTIEGKSDIIPVAYNKDGSFKSSSSVATMAEFEKIFKHIKKQMKEIGDSILGGRCDISPSLYDGHSPCEYCKYSSVCRFDKKGGKYNNFEKLSRTKAYEKLNELCEEES